MKEIIRENFLEWNKCEPGDIIESAMNEKQ